MIHSMTGYAATTGQFDTWSWSADMRAVNGRGLDLRLRIPDWLTGLEPTIRDVIKGEIARGSVTLNLRLSRDDSETGEWVLDTAALERMLAALSEIEFKAHEVMGKDLNPTKAIDILPHCRREKKNAETSDEDNAKLLAQLKPALATLVAEFNKARAQEGEALTRLLRGQLSQISDLVDAASDLVQERSAEAKENMVRNLHKVVDNVDGIDPDRLHQELALIAVKSDITEEIDRLRAHVDAANKLLTEGGVIGRKFDFLTQEFNREANTLCSKSQFEPLTRVGLDLKAVIDQMREQVQNLE